jgi:hypothetical protein
MYLKLLKNPPNLLNLMFLKFHLNLMYLMYR